MKQCKEEAHLMRCMHSHVLASHTITKPSLEALYICAPSSEKTALLTYDLWPRNSLRALPLRRPCTRMEPSKDAESTCVESCENATEVMPSVCARSKRCTHRPLATFHTLMPPPWSPVQLIIPLHLQCLSVQLYSAGHGIYPPSAPLDSHGHP
jgi:hypothetical protein